MIIFVERIDNFCKKILQFLYKNLTLFARKFERFLQENFDSFCVESWWENEHQFWDKPCIIKYSLFFSDTYTESVLTYYFLRICSELKKFYLYQCRKFFKTPNVFCRFSNVENLCWQIFLYNFSILKNLLRHQIFSLLFQFRKFSVMPNFFYYFSNLRIHPSPSMPNLCYYFSDVKKFSNP